MAIGNLAPIIPAIFTGPNGERLTADQIKRRQEIAESLMAQATDTSPNAGGWASIAAKGLAGFQAGRERRSADNAAGVNAAASAANMRGLLGSFLGGSTAMPAAASTGVGAELASTAPGGVGATIPATADAQQIRAGLIQRGLPEHIADGFLVNFQDESGLNPGINEANPTVPGSRGGFGLYQLTGPRRVAYESFAQERGVDPSDVDAQLDFLMTELQGPEKAAADRIMAAGDTPMAAQAIVNHFLRPAPEHRERRMAAYSQLTGSPVAMTDAAPAGATPGYQDPMVASPNASPVASALAAQPAAATVQPQMAQATMPPINPAVIETLTSPYASAEEKSVAQAMLGQYQSQQQAAEKRALAEQQRAAEIARRQSLAEQLNINPAYATDDEIWKGAAGNIFAAPSTSTVDGAVIDNRTGQPIYQAPVDAQTYAGYAEYEQSQGRTPLGPLEYEQALRRSGASQTNVDTGTIPTGFQAVRDAEGRLVRYDPVPGGPADMSSKNAASQEGRERSGGIVLEDVDRAVAAIEENPTLTTGLIGEWTKGIAGTPAKKVENLLQTIRANAAFDRLQQMRDASPTGGALGGVAIEELNLLKNAIGSLEQSNDSEDLVYNLRRVQKIYEDIIHGPEAAAQMREQRKAQSSSSQQQQENPLPPQTNGRKTSTGATWEVLD